MSNATQVTGVEITNIDALDLAVKNNCPTCELVRGQNTYLMWGSPRSNAAHVIRKKMTEQERRSSRIYEIGVVPVKGKTNAYNLLFDTHGYANGLLDEPGFVRSQDADIAVSNLLMHYRMAEATLTAAAVGDRIRFTQLTDGSWVSVTETAQRAYA